MTYASRLRDNGNTRGGVSIAALLITYDLNTPGQDYADFYKIIKTYPWAKLSESSYAVSTTDAPAVVFDKLFPHIDNNDRLFVILLQQGWKGKGPQDIYDWLRNHL